MRTVRLPGFRLALGFTLFYLAALVAVPLLGLVFKAGGLTPERFVEQIATPRALAAYRLSFLASLTAAAIDVVLGLLLAWVLVRYRFVGRSIVDALIDLPLALPTAVAGIALTTLYGEHGAIGQFLLRFGIKVAFTPLGIVLALAFVGFPFVVRAVQPIIESLDPEVEEAAATLGASRAVTFWRVTLPHLRPALLTGFALSFARALGEYGSVVFISGNMPLKTEIVPLLIMTKLEQFDYPAAAALAMVTLAFSALLLLVIHALRDRTARFYATQG
jgi:sulfate transport system permease protein